MSLDLSRYYLRTHSTSWSPKDIEVALNIKLDACIVPTADGSSARTDAGHLLVLDNFFGEQERQELLDFITEKGWQGPCPPGESWERATGDAADAQATWGLTDSALASLINHDLPAKIEIQSRLCKLYPEAQIIHMPSDLIQGRTPNNTGGVEGPGTDDASEEGSTGASVPPSDDSISPPTETKRRSVDCCHMLANAAVPGDQFRWHVDADPWNLPESAWTERFGHYVNREPGRPRMVSLLLYLCGGDWPRAWDAETLFLDSGSDTGVLVRPKPYRVVLFDQDLTHRLSPPSRAAPSPRYSLVWKLVFLPRPVATPAAEDAGGAARINDNSSNNQYYSNSNRSNPVSFSFSRPQWPQPVAFGSAARIQSLVSQLGAARRRRRGSPAEAAEGGEGQKESAGGEGGREIEERADKSCPPVRDPGSRVLVDPEDRAVASGAPVKRQRTAEEEGERGKEGENSSVRPL